MQIIHVITFQFNWGTLGVLELCKYILIMQALTMKEYMYNLCKYLVMPGSAIHVLARHVLIISPSVLHKIIHKFIPSYNL